MKDESASTGLAECDSSALIGGVGVVWLVVNKKRVDKEGYPALWRALAAFACHSPGQSLGEVAKRPRVGAA